MSKTLALTSALALILASGSAFAADNYANSTQTGDSNSSQITQNSQQGHGHHATSDVTGDHNTVGIDQTSTTDGYGWASVKVDGYAGQGDYNSVDVGQSSFQGSDSNQQKANIDVYGDGNDITTTQKYGTQPQPNRLTVKICGNAEGSNNTLDIFQHGNGETSTTAIWGDHNNVGVNQGAGANTATVYIDGNANDDEGDYNLVQVSQDHGTQGYQGNTATVKIYGDGNNLGKAFSAEAGAIAGGLNPGDIKQSGALNVARVNLGTPGGLDANNNAFAVQQTGYDNALYQNTTGDWNQSVVLQNGDANGANLTQIGNYNVATMQQTGASNSSVVTQNGSYNHNVVNQTN